MQSTVSFSLKQDKTLLRQKFKSLTPYCRNWRRQLFIFSRLEIKLHVSGWNADFIFPQIRFTVHLLGRKPEFRTDNSKDRIISLSDMNLFFGQMSTVQHRIWAILVRFLSLSLNNLWKVINLEPDESRNSF